MAIALLTLPLILRLGMFVDIALIFYTVPVQQNRLQYFPVLVLQMIDCYLKD